MANLLKTFHKLIYPLHSFTVTDVAVLLINSIMGRNRITVGELLNVQPSIFV